MSIDANQEADILAASRERMRKKNRDAEEKRKAADAGKNDEENNFAYGEDGFASMHSEEAEFSDTENETKADAEAEDTKDTGDANSNASDENAGEDGPGPGAGGNSGAENGGFDEEAAERKRAEGEKVRREWEQNFHARMHRGEKQKHVKEEEKIERKQKAGELMGMYGDLMAADNFETVFGPDDISLPIKDRLAVLKKAYRKFSIKLHPDKYSMCSKEVKDVAEDAFKLLAIFYEEAQYAIDPTGSVDAQNASGHAAAQSRRSHQRSANGSISEKVRAAMEAEDNNINKQRLEDEEDHAKWRAKMEKERNEWKEKWQAEYGSGETKDKQEAGSGKAEAESDPAEKENDKSDQRDNESAENAGGRENGNETPENESNAEAKEQKEDSLEAALKSARELYADTDYRDRTATQRIRKYFNMRSNEKYAEGENIVGARKIYEDALRALKDDRVAKLKEKGLEGKELEKELQNLFTIFNHKETLEFYDARTKAKMDYLAETENKSTLKKTWDKVALQSNKIANWYNKKVPTVVKWGLAGAAMLPGMQTFAVGKRAWGAFMMVAAGGMQVDKLAQLKDNMVNKKESKKISKEVMRENESGEKVVDYEWLNSVLDDNISQLDRKLDSMVVRSQVNKFVAFTSAAFLGASTFSRIAEILQHGGAAKEAGAGILSKIFGFKGLAGGAGVAGSVESANGFDMSNVNPKNFEGFEDDFIGQMENIGEAKSSGAFANSYEKFKAFAGLQGETPLADAMENRSAAPIDMLREAEIPAGAELPVETMTVKEGSSFIGTLKHVYLENHREEFLKLHPEMAKYSNDQIAFRLAQRYGDKALGGELPDFVKAGAKMTFDPKTMEVHFLKPGDVGHFAEVEASGDAFDNDVDLNEVVDNDSAGSKEVVTEKSVEDVAKEAVEKHVAEEMAVKQEKIAGVQADFAEARNDYSHAADSATNHPEGGDGASDAQRSAMHEADKAMHQNAEYIKNNTDFYPETSKQTILIQKAIAGGDRGVWNEFQDLEYDRAIADDKVGPRLAAVREQFEKEYDPEGYKSGRSYNFVPREGETIREWTKRVAYRIMEKRYKIAS